MVKVLGLSEQLRLPWRMVDVKKSFDEVGSCPRGGEGWWN